MPDELIQSQTPGSATSESGAPPAPNPQASPASPAAPEGAAPAPGAAVREAAPSSLTLEDVKAPEGSVALSDGLRSDFLTVMNNAGLSAKDRATKLLDLQARAADEITKNWMDTWTAAQEKSAEEVRQHYGNKLDATMASCAKVLDAYGGPELRQALDISGMGNNLVFFQFLEKIAGHLNEGSPVVSGSIRTGEDLAKSLYPSMKG